MAYNAMVVAGVSTVFINANPLLKFDGYFALCDVIESPNLAQRANEYWGRQTESWLFGLEQEKPPNLGAGEAWIAALYAPAAFMYRVFLSVTIALMVASQYLLLGAILAIWSLTMSLVVPVSKALWKVIGGPRLHRKRARAVGVTGAGLTAVLVLLSAVPMPSHTVVMGLAWLPDSAAVRAQTDGFVAQVGTTPGARVEAHSDLVTLQEPSLVARVTSLNAQLTEAELRQSRYRGVDPVLSQSAAVDVENATERLAVAQQRASDLVVRAALPGMFRLALPTEDLPGRYVQRGQTLGWVLPDAVHTVRLVVPQSAIDKIRGGVRQVQVLPVTPLAKPISARITLMAEGGSFTLPDPAFAMGAGGRIATDPSDASGLRALERIFVMDVRVDETSDVTLKPGLRVYVRLTHDPEPLGRQVVRWARATLLRELDL